MRCSVSNVTTKRLPHLLQVSQRDGARYPISYFHLARLYELKGDLKLAEAAFVQAAPHTTNPQFLLDVSRVREKLGDFKGALEASNNTSNSCQTRARNQPGPTNASPNFAAKPANSSSHK